MAGFRLAVPISLVVLLFGGLGVIPASPGSPEPEPRSLQEAGVLGDYGNLPLSFEANRGQTDPRVRFVSRGDGYALSLTDSGPVFSLGGSVYDLGALGPATPGATLEMDLVGAEPDPVIVGRDRLPGVVNYLKGSDPSGWHTGIPTYGRVRYEEVYPGIDLAFRGTGDGLEYDFLLAPGSDPSTIAVRFRGTEAIRVDGRGDLMITTAAGEIVHGDPVIYQEIGGERQEIAGGYRLNGGRIGFALGPYDLSLPLVIDPVVLAYSSFLGGSGSDNGAGIAVDGTGAAYLTGSAMDVATDFPTTPGAFAETHSGGTDAFITKLNPSGTALVYSTFLGGNEVESGTGISLDGSGAAYVTGITLDDTVNFPTTPGAFQETHNGGYDAFVTKLDPSGAALMYSTFLGGSSFDAGRSIDVDGAGAAYVTGETFDGTTDFPTTGAAYDSAHNGSYDAFLTKLDPTGAALSYSTFLGGSDTDEGEAVAVDGGGAAYVTGTSLDAPTPFPTTTGAFDNTHNGGVDAFITKLGASGAALAYSTFLGGSSGDAGEGIAVDGLGAAYITGSSFDGTTDLPTTPGAFDQIHNGGGDAFVTKLSASGDALTYSTFLGGNGYDPGRALTVDGSGSAIITGETEDAATDFPTTTGAFDSTHNGEYDAFVAKLGTDGAALVDSTFLGGSNFDRGEAVAVDGGGATYVTGTTADGATGFPTTTGAFDTTHNGGSDAFVAKLVEGPPAPGPAPTPPPSGSCKGKPATITGTDAGETIRGTSGPDVIAAVGGNDKVKAQGGKDLVCAGDGSDTVNGGGGKDRLFGEDGKDKLKGGAGDDKVNGGKGKDTCVGGSGDDKSPKCEKEKSVP